jgi:hypothetical protein
MDEVETVLAEVEDYNGPLYDESAFCDGCNLTPQQCLCEAIEADDPYAPSLDPDWGVPELEFQQLHRD